MVLLMLMMLVVASGLALQLEGEATLLGYATRTNLLRISIR